MGWRYLCKTHNNAWVFWKSLKQNKQKKGSTEAWGGQKPCDTYREREEPTATVGLGGWLGVTTVQLKAPSGHAGERERDCQMEKPMRRGGRFWRGLTRKVWVWWKATGRQFLSCLRGEPTFLVVDGGLGKSTQGLFGYWQWRKRERATERGLWLTERGKVVRLPQVAGSAVSMAVSGEWVLGLWEWCHSSLCREIWFY